MFSAHEPASSSAKNPLSSALENPAIAHCFEIYVAVHKKALAAGKTEFKAGVDAIMAYRTAMPQLSGASNIADYIACLGYAVTLDLIEPHEVAKLLGMAKMALAALPKPPKKQPAEK